MKISRPHAIQNIEQLPGLDLVLQDFHKNLRSEKWEPPELSNWGSNPTDFSGRYQLLGNVCFLQLHVDLTDISISNSADDLSLPVKAFRGGVLTPGYPLIVPGQIILHDFFNGTTVGSCRIHSGSNFKLIPPLYTPASGTRRLAVSGYYWVE